MATLYPTQIQTFTNPSPSDFILAVSHSAQHATENDTLSAIQTVMGTTAGTSVLKDFVAGQFPARVNAGGTIVQTLTGGTINSTVIGTISQGSDAAGDVYYRGTTGLFTRLPIGTPTQVLTVSAGTVPSWTAAAAGGGGDWTTYSAVTPTTGTLDSPSFPIVFAGVDLTTTLYVGMRVRITQTTVKYFIITKIAFSTDTTVTLYGGSDYALVASGTTAIAVFGYSTVKVPAGFNPDPLKWSEGVSAAGTTQGSPTAGTWYNLGGSLSIPIGSWFVTFQGTMFGTKSTSTAADVASTLSTANSTQSDITWTSSIFHQSASATPIASCSFYKSGHLLLTAKASYFANATCVTASQTNMGLTDPNAVNQKVTIRAICGYL